MPPKIKIHSIERVFSEQNGQVIDNKLIEQKMTNRGITIRGFDNGKKFNITRKFRKSKKSRKRTRKTKSIPQIYMVLHP